MATLAKELNVADICHQPAHVGHERKAAGFALQREPCYVPVLCIVVPSVAEADVPPSIAIAALQVKLFKVVDYYCY